MAKDLIRFASIDIGSNAVRLLVSDVTRKGRQSVFKKTELIRIPIRLGEDAFLKKKISGEKISKLITTLKAFRLLIEVYEVQKYRACATSAMREAQNRQTIVQRASREAGIKIEIIDGKKEAELIYVNHIEKYLDKRKAYLYIDVGGGSTELTLFSQGKRMASRSFDVGSIRMLHNKIEKDYWDAFKTWVRETTRAYAPVTAIGSGGTINKLYKMSQEKNNHPLSYQKLKTLSGKIERLSFEDRIRILGLNPDRADVIVPASKIILSVMKNGKINNLLVPQFGLADGIVRQLHSDWTKK